MKLIGNLKKQVDEAADIAEKKKLIEKAGMKLTDDELNMVAGGFNYTRDLLQCQYNPNCAYQPGSSCCNDCTLIRRENFSPS